MRVLLNDDAIIAVDKPPHVLSVPGRVHRVDTEFCPRNVQWMNAISELAATYSHRKEERDSALSLIATKLLEGKHTVPRQKAKFTRFLERVAKVTDQSILNKVWEDLESIDHRLNRFDTSSLPPELISAADFAETIAKSKIFHVHRLDQETSGVLVFAKSSEVARDLGRQFRDREVITCELIQKQTCCLICVMCHSFRLLRHISLWSLAKSLINVGLSLFQ